jgi:hypothetical protein
MIYRSLTPEQRLSTEQAINDHLAASFGPGRRVCLHPDRTSSRLDNGGYKIECDYCPSFSTVAPGGTWPDIEPRYYMEDPEVPLYQKLGFEQFRV